MNLLEKYLYEFSQWEKTDVNEDGNYEYMDCYFTEDNRYPYFIKVDSKLAGFIMVSDYPEVPEETTDFCLSEFFVLHKYRRTGVGRQAVVQVLDKHHGRWQLKRHPHNTASVYFWDHVISEYTNGAVGFAQCQLRFDYVEGTESSPVGYLEGIFVKDKFRHRGYAKELLKNCEI